jgi:hypothetical protein
MAAGVVQPKLVVRNTIDQLDLQLKQGVGGLRPSTGPVRTFPERNSRQADQRGLRAAHAAGSSGRDPARLLSAARLPQRRVSPALPARAWGLVHMKGRAAPLPISHRADTTLPLAADEVHDLGTEGGRADPGRDGGDQEPRSASKGTLASSSTSPHGAAVQAEVQGLAARAI